MPSNFQSCALLPCPCGLGFGGGLAAALPLWCPHLWRSSAVRSLGLVLSMPSFRRRRSMTGAKRREPSWAGGHRRLNSASSLWDASAAKRWRRWEYEMAALGALNQQQQQQRCKGAELSWTNTQVTGRTRWQASVIVLPHCCTLSLAAASATPGFGTARGAHRGTCAPRWRLPAGCWRR